MLKMPVSSSLMDVLSAHGHKGVHDHYIDLDRATDCELLVVALHVARYR